MYPSGFHAKALSGAELMRSYLFSPGDSTRKMEKAASSGADAVILDLEDSVAIADKPAARSATAEFLNRAGRRDSKLYVRVNALDTGMTDVDLQSIRHASPDGIMLPKSRKADDVLTLSAMLHELDIKAPDGLVKIIAIATETADSLFHLGTYQNAGDRLNALCWGAEDLSADLGAQTNVDKNGNYTGPYELARTLCLVGARAAGVEPVDGIYGNYRDEDGLWASCRRALRDGFTGKLAIHPAQVNVINTAFTPSEAEIERAARIVEAFELAGNPGVIGFDGEMLDKPHLDRARKLLNRAAM